MNERHEEPLAGCSPEPLMSYLKALGILRLVSEQNDNKARGFWREDVFVLQSSLDQDSLVRFFLEEYKPTPIVGAWNSDGGVQNETGSSVESIRAILSSSEERLEPFRNSIKRIQSIPSLSRYARYRRIVNYLEKRKKRTQLGPRFDEMLKALKPEAKRLKGVLLFEIRSELPSDCIEWMDASMVLGEEEFRTSPILGSGGCDGRMEFSANFVSNLLSAFSSDLSKTWLEGCLLDRPNIQLVQSAVGQFSPGWTGGPNATQGMERDSLVNPWDYILLIEGTLLFAGVVTKRLGVEQIGKATFPFTVNPSRVGYGSSADAEDSRGEMWLPLWSRPTSLMELKALISEGRAEIGSRSSRTGVDFARAIAGLGVSRGISHFVRYGFLKRNGLAYIASPLGRFDVMKPKRDTDLLRQIDPWLDRFRHAVSGEKVPPRFKTASQRIEQSIFNFCQYGGARFFSDILCALGNAERELANGEKFRTDKNIRPIPRLSQDWLQAANDESTEFELALALAHIYDQDKKIGSFRTNLEPIEQNGWPKWAQKSRCVAWKQTDLAGNLAAVLERRLMDGERANCSNLPIAFARAAQLSTVARFLWYEVDDKRIEELLWGCLLVQPPTGKLNLKRNALQNTPPIPRAYALLKQLFLPYPHPLLINKEETIRPESAILPLLRASRIPEACKIATRRLRASGLVPLTHPRVRQSCSAEDWSESETSQMNGKRLAASLLIPVSSQSIRTLSCMVLREHTEGSEKENVGGIQ